MTPAGPQDTDIDDDTSVLYMLLEHRTEILLGLVLAHLMGWTTTATEYVGGCI